jgi:hexosaminidase
MRASVLILLMSLLRAAGFTAGPITPTPALIPVPKKMEVTEGQFWLVPAVHIEVDAASGDSAQYLATKLRASTGYLLQIRTNNQPSPEKGIIQITTNGARPELSPEGYELNVQPYAVEITAPTQAGLFYGVQTLLQLFPPEIFSKHPVTNGAWKIPFAAHIVDQPRFKWRGFMLDCSRHFFPKDDVKRVLDEMAMHKLNTFHWHLTDDQAWRIEIKKYPKLTEVGAWRHQSKLTSPHGDGNPSDNYQPAWSVPPASAFGPDGRYGGYYTQDDIREIVAYASERHITVVPEIEMPGHAVAALAAYPQLSCDKGHYDTDAKAGVNSGVFCVSNDDVLTFLHNVLSEVFQLFPGKYVHVGGDEVNAAVKAQTWGKCPSCQALMKANGFTNLDQLQGWFTGQIGKYVDEHGKSLIGWSEIAEAPLPNNAAIMDWIGGAVQAATNGHDVVMTPTRYCYLDYYQSLDHGTEPRAQGFLPLERVYSFEPVPAALPPQFASHILGGQGNLWTEYVPSLAHAEFMMFPRLCALAEIGWSPKETRDWNNFQQRLQTHELRFGELGLNYRRDLSVPVGDWKPAQLTTNSAGTNLEWDVTSEIKGPAQYRITFEHTRGSGLMINSVSLLEDGKPVASDSHAGYAARNPTKPVYVLNVAQTTNAKYTLRASVSGTDSSGRVSLVLWTGTRTQ